MKEMNLFISASVAGGAGLGAYGGYLGIFDTILMVMVVPAAIVISVHYLIKSL